MWFYGVTRVNKVALGILVLHALLFASAAAANTYELVEPTAVGLASFPLVAFAVTDTATTLPDLARAATSTLPDATSLALPNQLPATAEGFSSAPPLSSLNLLLMAQNDSSPGQPLRPPSTLSSPTDNTAQPGQSTVQPQVGAIGVGGAFDQLDLALGQRPVYSDLLTLQDRITALQQPVINLVTRYSTQSDNVDISQTELSEDLYFDNGTNRLRPGIQYATYEPKSGPSVTEYSVGADGSYRINDWSAVAGDFWLNDITSRGLDDNVLPTYDVFVTLWPNDFFRIDIDTKRETFDNIPSLRLGISAYSILGSLDYTPSDDLRFSVRGGDSFYTDTNERRSGEAEVTWRIPSLTILQVGLRVSGFSFTEQLAHGYFDPSGYWAGEGMVRIQKDLTDSLNVELAASGGIEDAYPGGTKPLVKSSLQLTYKLEKNWTVDGGIAYFSSRESNSAGFDRTSFNIGLHYKMD